MLPPGRCCFAIPIIFWLENCIITWPNGIGFCGTILRERRFGITFRMALGWRTSGSHSKEIFKGSITILRSHLGQFFQTVKSVASLKGSLTRLSWTVWATALFLFGAGVGSVEPPYLVMPITMEPSKPRMCHDERFLNLWIKDLPLSLDYISNLPRYVSKSHFQTVFDDKSGYDHLKLSPESSSFFGLEWKGWYFTYSTIPFGWKASAYLYHTVGMAATSAVRLWGIPCSQYIDDRHIGQLTPRLHSELSNRWSNFQLAEAAAFIVCTTLVSLGYFIGLKKSVLIPQKRVKFLRFLCDSELQAFLVLCQRTRKSNLLSFESPSLAAVQPR